MNFLMNQLEKILGREYRPFGGDPFSIPCNEFSTPEKLCRNPKVSILMLTYNHEKYIREAIMGVVGQSANFEYELVIGEDCSQDKTREICFEMQNRYPDKIRVLWADVNVNERDGNFNRTFVRCRGKYIAFCEGDDYWTDHKKLQKQIELIVRTGSSGSFAFNEILNLNGTIEHNVYDEKPFIDNEDYFRHYFHTSTYLFDRDVISDVKKKYCKIPVWYDSVLCHCILSEYRIALLPEIVSVRRVTGKGIATSLTPQQRMVLNLKQCIPLYEFGPKEKRWLFAKAILMVTSGFFNKKGNLLGADYSLRNWRSMLIIFGNVSLKYWYMAYVWKCLFLMVKNSVWHMTFNRK